MLYIVLYFIYYMYIMFNLFNKISVFYDNYVRSVKTNEYSITLGGYWSHL